jgi:adenine-specific DNA-methyltransferase
MPAIDSRILLSYLSTNSEKSLISFDRIDFFKTDFKIAPLKNLLQKSERVDLYDLSPFIDSAKVFDLHNRKYLGSKYGLLDFIEGCILDRVGKNIESFFDAFAGTGVVAQRFRKYAEKVISNDFLYSNYVVHKTFISSTRASVSIKRLDALIGYLNSLPSAKSYAFANFGDTYFTSANAGKIDSVREEIERLAETRECSEHEKNCLIASLLYSMDKSANTVGQYDAFLKHLGSKSNSSGKHVIDSNVYKEIVLKRPLIYFDGVNEVHCEDSISLAERVSAEVTYIDPPYNSRQYVDCYHVLENVARWQKPVTYGKTKKYERTVYKSDFSKKRNAMKAFSQLISNLRSRHIFLSYNSEGILTDEQILSVLNIKGKVSVFEKEYPVFGNGAGVSVRRTVKERLFYCKVF